MKNIFVTGGTGLVGGHLIEELLSSYPQAKIVTLMRSLGPMSYFARQGFSTRTVTYFGDIRDQRTVRDIVYNEEIDTIFHLAAQPIVDVALANPRDTWETNLNGTINVMEAARGNSSIKAVVVASSDKAYGKANFLPYTEDHPLQGLHPYDASKSCTDLIARTYAVCYGTPVVVSRFGNIYGPGDLNFNRLIPGAMKALALDEPLQIRSNGQLTRDFVYVKDVARGYILLANNSDTCAGEAFNVTSGVTMSVLDMLAKIGSIVEKNVPHVVLNIAKCEIAAQTLSDEKIRQRLGWQPTRSLEDAIRETWAWYRDLLSKKI